jgi:hypothetical protein
MDQFGRRRATRYSSSNLSGEACGLANGVYSSRCRAAGIKPHPIRFPVQLPTFFVPHLTAAGDLVLDPLAGSRTTIEAGERERRERGHAAAAEEATCQSSWTQGAAAGAALRDCRKVFFVDTGLHRLPPVAYD